MKVKVPFAAVLLFVALAFVALPAAAQDPVKAAPQAFTQKLDNDHVRVLEYRTKPGVKEAMHSHGPSVLLAASSDPRPPTGNPRRSSTRPVM
jgi:hypothetical protein